MSNGTKHNQEEIAADPLLEMAYKLYEKFDESEEFKDPRGHTYIKEKAIVKRLNQVFGPFGWQLTFSDGPEGRVVCAIKARIDGEWLERSGGSAMMKQDDPGQYKVDGTVNKSHEDTAKTAYTDAFKRAARMWGIGQYLLGD